MFEYAVPPAIKNEEQNADFHIFKFSELFGVFFLT